MPFTSTQFDFNAMLMYGFVADADLQVTEINQSLQLWINSQTTPIVVSLRENIAGGGKPQISDFIDGLFDPDSEAGTGKLFDEKCQEMNRVVRYLNEGKKIHELRIYHEGNFIIRRVFRQSPDPNRVILATRMVKPGGSQMIEGTLTDRVDFVVVCIVTRDNQRAPWVVRGFQAQLQEAWLRLEPLIRRGNQTAAVALLGRNLSHNIGSHALFWLTQDMRQAQDTDRYMFYAYLRDRMELLGGIATFMPLAFTTWRLSEIVEKFCGNPLFVDRLCRSEGIRSIRVECSSEVVVSIPGGPAGIHLLYSLLENTIRDSAKYARDSAACPEEGELDHLTIRLLADYCSDRFVRLAIIDDGKNFEEASKPIQKALNSLRIVDESGSLLPGAWGVKERFACAVMLRGWRLEQIPLTQVMRNRTSEDVSFGDYAPPGEPNFLRIYNADGCLGWELFLLCPEPPVLVVGVASSENKAFSKCIAIRTMEWLRSNIENPAALRHRFLILYDQNAEDSAWLSSVSAKLPERRFLIRNQVQLNTNLTGYAILNNGRIDLGSVSEQVLLGKWVDHLLARRKLAKPVIVLEGGWEDLELEGEVLGNPQVYALRPHTLSHWQQQQSEQRIASAPIILVRSHTHKLEKLSPLHYEPHERGDRLRAEVESLRKEDKDSLILFSLRLMEAALIRVIIIDERIDRTVDEEHDPDRKGVPLRTLLRWRGIDVQGREYGTPGYDKDISTLRGWIAGNKYDVLIVHLGIIEKIASKGSLATEEILTELQAEVGYVIIHSGRPVIPDFPRGTRFILLSTLMSWVDPACSKMQMVEELFALRGV
jgi:hypothetical protein